MSDAISALPGSVYDGFVRVEELGPSGMITLRGELASAELQKAVKAATGLAVPGQRGADFENDSGVAWMSPDELMLFVRYGDVADKLAHLEKTLSGTHYLAVDVSDARAMFGLSGEAVREVIAKLCPVDIAPGMFGPGEIRRTRMAQVPAAIWMPAEGQMRVVCFRSVARYVFDLLKDAARPGGEAGLFA